MILLLNFGRKGNENPGKGQGRPQQRAFPGMSAAVQTVDRSGRDVHIFNREKKFGGREMGHRLLNKYLVLMDVGGAVYVLLELAWRGRSHWTMFVLGGLCFIGLGLINEVLPWDMPLWEQAAVGVLLITALEFFTGCVVNLMLGWQVWDYSDLPWNILGQVSLKYSALWLPVSLAGIVLDDCLRYRWFGEERPRYNLGLTRKWRWSVRL